MANATFVVPCPAGQWTDVADGTTYLSVQLQSNSLSAVQAAIAATQPAANSAAFVLLEPGFVTFPLASGDKLWCMPVGSFDATVRGIGTHV